MNVARLELCKELFELSGWLDTDYFYAEYDKNKYHTSAESRDVYILQKQGQATGIPAYDLGYLLRKLPRYLVSDLLVADDMKFLSLEPNPTNNEEWCIWYSNEDFQSPKYNITADTPENATCKLAIELFKQEILKKDDNHGKQTTIEHTKNQPGL